MADAVLLIPGFFGFGRFGEGTDTPLDYFAGVSDIIRRERPELAIHVHEPPPTGSLHERIATLHDKVVELTAPNPATRVHLIGHSTGGVDAWLYTRPSYRWSGGPRPDQRADVLKQVADVVTLSAPFRGTPVAKYARTERDVFLMAVFALTVFTSNKKLIGKLTAGLLGSVVRRLLRGTNPGDQMSTLSMALDGMRPQLGDKFVRDLSAFFTRIVEDRQLLRDLTVESMKVVNEALTGPDHEPVRSYVSVSPRPKESSSVSRIAELFALFADPLAGAEAALYSHLYHDTAHGEALGERPTASGGLLLGEVDEHLNDVHASDGVVPVRSQTLHGHAAGIVLGDHLDVTGHFEGAQQRNVFESGANFKQPRLDELWTHIATGLSR